MRKKKKEKAVINVHYAQHRKMKGMEKIREFVTFGCAQWQSISKLGSNPSSQLMPQRVCWYILYNFVCFTHTNATLRWIDL